MFCNFQCFACFVRFISRWYSFGCNCKWNCFPYFLLILCIAGIQKYDLSCVLIWYISMLLKCPLSTRKSPYVFSFNSLFTWLCPLSSNSSHDSRHWNWWTNNSKLTILQSHHTASSCHICAGISLIWNALFPCFSRCVTYNSNVT